MFVAAPGSCGLALKAPAACSTPANTLPWLEDAKRGVDLMHLTATPMTSCRARGRGILLCAHLVGRAAYGVPP